MPASTGPLRPPELREPQPGGSRADQRDDRAGRDGPAGGVAGQGNESSGYSHVLRLPGALRAFLPALLARLSLAMMTLALVLAVEAATGSFAVAGAAAGTAGITNVVASPFRARLVDRWGQRRSLNLLACAYATGLSALAALTGSPGRPTGSAVWIVVTAASIGLFAPPLGAAMRVVWGSITPTTALRTRAYTLDAVAEELLFTVGPLVVAVVVAVASPAAALLVAAAASVVGTVTMTSSSASRALIGSSVTKATISGRPLRQRGFRPVLVALVGAGIILGVIEIAASAFAVDAGSRELAGPLMAGFAGGSAIGGLAYGSRDWRSGPSRRLLALGLGMVVATGTLIVAPSLLTIGALLVVVGLFLAPSLVTGYLLADLYTGAEARTEASSRINTSVNAGAALAVTTGGGVIDRFGVDAAIATAVGAALLCLLLPASQLLRPALAEGTAPRVEVT